MISCLTEYCGQEHAIAYCDGVLFARMDTRAGKRNRSLLKKVRELLDNSIMYVL